MGEGSAVNGGSGKFFLGGVVFGPSGGEKRFGLKVGNEWGVPAFHSVCYMRDTV